MAKTPGTNRIKSARPRSERDYYRTPDALADKALDYLIQSENYWRFFKLYGSRRVRVLDPGCGSGVWSESAYDRFTVRPLMRQPTIHAVDLEPQFQDDRYKIIKGDFLSLPLEPPYDVIIGNPPYSLAEQFIRRSMELVEERGYVYFLLQLNFIGSRKREIGLFKQFPLKEMVVLTRRPSFFTVEGKVNSTDTINYAMFLWQKGYTGNPVINWMYWNY